MKISFVETEPGEQEFFLAGLPDHEMEFVRDAGEVSEETEAVSVFIYSRIDSAFLDAHPQLRLVATRSTTTEHVDREECARRGIAIRCVESYGDHTVAEHTFALLLALSRRLREVMTTNKRGFTYEALRGFELRGKTFGIVGLGRIGQQVIPIARAFGMTVLVHDGRINSRLAEALGTRAVSLDELLSGSDIISLHASLNQENYHLLNRATLAKCRRGVIILNTARGGLIDTHALNEALESGQVGGAGLDVLEDERVMRNDAARILTDEIVQNLRASPEAVEARNPRRIRELSELMRGEEILARPNVVFTPHIAFNSFEAIERINRETVSSILHFAANVQPAAEKAEI